MLNLEMCIDAVFVAQLYVNDDVELSSSQKWCLFGFGVSFIIVPLIGNLVQLHKEIKVWISDVYSKHCVQSWMISHLRHLYMIAILFGSSFAAVDICNSNLFHLSLFNMGLNKRQKAIFKNQRMLSIVFLENIPQLILQIVYLFLTLGSSVSTITIIAMIFSLLSIILSIFNYVSSSLLIECETITVIVMDVLSQQLANTQPRKFRKLIVQHRKPICRELSKIIEVDKGLIELLTPIQNQTGTKLTFYIRNNDSSDIKKVASNMVDTIKNGIDSGSLAKVKIFLNFFKYIV